MCKTTTQGSYSKFTFKQDLSMHLLNSLYFTFSVNIYPIALIEISSQIVQLIKFKSNYEIKMGLNQQKTKT